MRVASPLRLIIAIVVGLVLAGVLALHSLSLVLTKTAPALATSLMAANGHARQALAMGMMEEAAGEPAQLAAAARIAAPMARAALKSDPLLPRALAILAAAERDQERRSSILEAAAQVNRADLYLQGLVLQDRALRGDVPGTLATFDQILRAHPQTSREFFPALVTALEEPSSLTDFAELLDGSSPWHERFLSFAVGRPEALLNLAELRGSLQIEDAEFDRRLIAGLAAQGAPGEALAVLGEVRDAPNPVLAPGVLDWSARYPPFEWRLADERGFRAQLDKDGTSLEISVRPGSGGVIAERVFRAPQAPISIGVRHDFPSSGQARNVRLQLRCHDSRTPFYDADFAATRGVFDVGLVPQDCAYVAVGLNARAWSGQSALAGNLAPLEVALMPGGKTAGRD